MANGTDPEKELTPSQKRRAIIRKKKIEDIRAKELGKL